MAATLRSWRFRLRYPEDCSHACWLLHRMATDEHYAPVPDGFIRLVSKDGFEFLVKEEYALVSNVIKMMLNGTSPLLPFTQSPHHRI